MKILFLDIDGVLNSTQQIIRAIRTDYNSDTDYCPIACSNIQHLLDCESDLQIVLTSTKRLMNSLDQLKGWLHDNGIESSRIIDVTPDKLLGTRGDEIASWLFKHPAVSKYAIVDDNSIGGELSSQFVKIDRREGFMWIKMLETAKMLDIQNANMVTL